MVMDIVLLLMCIFITALLLFYYFRTNYDVILPFFQCLESLLKPIGSDLWRFTIGVSSPITFWSNDDDDQDDWLSLKQSFPSCLLRY